jgi:hypothetical protein
MAEKRGPADGDGFVLQMKTDLDVGEKLKRRGYLLYHHEP